MTAETDNKVISLMQALAPFAALADVCEHFHKDPGAHICSWRIEGERSYGPTVANVYTARDVLFAAGADIPATELRMRGIDDIIDDALRAEARLLLAHCTEAQINRFKEHTPGGVEIAQRSKLVEIIPLLQHLVTLNAKVARAGAA